MLINIYKKITTNKILSDLIKGGFASFVFQIFGIALSYMFILMVSRLYGAESMGVFALSFTVLNIAVLFGKFGLDVSIVKFVSGNFGKKNFNAIKDIYSKIVLIAVAVDIPLTLLLYFCAPYLADEFFKKPSLTVPFQLISLGILPMSLRFIHANALRGMQEIKIYSFLQSVSMYLFALIALALMYFLISKYPLDPIYSILFGIAVGAVISLYIWLKKSKFFSYGKSHSMTINEILSVSTPLLMSSSIMLILGMADTIMLGMFKSESDVGVYNVAYKIATAGMIVFMAISSISAPKIAEAYSLNDESRLRNVILNTIKLIGILSIPIYIVIFLFSSQILNLFGNEFKQGTVALILLSIGFLIKSLMGTSEYVLQMTDQQKQLIVYATIAAIVNIFLNWVLIPIYGITGAAFSSMFSVIVYQILLFQKANRKFKITIKYHK